MKNNGRLFFVKSKDVVVLIIITICLSSLIYFQGCSHDNENPVQPEQKKEFSGETTAGQWKPVLITSVLNYRLQAPPDVSSNQTKAELNELHSLQTSSNDQIISNINYWNNKGIIRWNEIARHLVIKNGVNPPKASRIYALLSVGQYDALVAAWYNKYLFQRQNPNWADNSISTPVSLSAEPSYPSEHAVIATVSSRILAYLFPKESDSLNYRAETEKSSRLYAGANYRSDISAGDSLGGLIADEVIKYATADNSDAVWTGTIPEGKQNWHSGIKPPQAPLLPAWGKTKPWLMTQLPVITPPPSVESDEFKAALAEVRKFSDTRTAEQLGIAMYWADGAGTYTPPGHWNDIACGKLNSAGFNEIRTARALALMNMAIMDAGICCWDAKYTFWYCRPSQMDSLITMPVGLPNFPSYTSGHSSFSGAASTVLSYILPSLAQEFHAMAEEAAISRLYGGIHYRFDSQAGLDNGRMIGQLAVEKGINDGSGK